MGTFMSVALVIVLIAVFTLSVFWFMCKLLPVDNEPVEITHKSLSTVNSVVTLSPEQIKSLVDDYNLILDRKMQLTVELEHLKSFVNKNIGTM